MKNYVLSLSKLLLLGAGCAYLSTTLFADWELITDFSDFTVGDQTENPPPAEANFVMHWKQSENLELFADIESETFFGIQNPSDGNNLVFNLFATIASGSEAVRAAIPLPTEIADGEIATIYYWAYISGPLPNFSIGVSDVAPAPDTTAGPFILEKPTQWGDYESQFVFFNTVFRIRDPLLGGFTDTDTTMPTDQWVEFWQVIDNDEKRTQIYFRDAAARLADEAPTLLPIERGQSENDAGRADDWYYFRNFSAEQAFVGEGDPLDGTLKSLYFGYATDATTGQDPVFFDNFYINYDGNVNFSPFDTPPSNTYGGYDIVEMNGMDVIDTDELGELVIDDAPWLWSMDLLQWIYAPESYFTQDGLWNFIPAMSSGQ